MKLNKTRGCGRLAFYNSIVKVPLLLTAVIIAIASCASEQEQPPAPLVVETAEPVETVELIETAPEIEPVLVVEAPAEPEFNPASISQEEFDNTKVDLTQFIGDLNRIVRSQDYNGWVAHLSPAYLAAISSPENLARISASGQLKSRGIVLTSARDYFLHVVVPARKNDRVDDIEFVSHSRVKAFTLSKGQRLRLYDLENTGNGWLIIN
jgi:hypothetical protein